MTRIRSGLAVVVLLATQVLAACSLFGDRATRDLISTVTDVKTLEGSQSDRFAVFVLLTKRNGAIVAAVEEVKLRQSERDAVAALVQFIDSKKSSKIHRDELQCANAAFALGAFGTVAADALPILRVLTQHRDQFVASESKEAIKKIEKT